MSLERPIWDYATVVVSRNMEGGRILIVDDDPRIRESVTELLVEEGYLVDSATDGVSALQHLASATPDVILLDVMMPGMNGREFLHSVRIHAHYCDIPVIVMSAVHGIDLNRVFALGADDIIEKPFDTNDLLNKLALASFRGRASQQPEPTHLGPLEDGDVVVVVDSNATRWQQLEQTLGQDGYVVVAVPHNDAELARLAQALEPRAILIEADSAGLTPLELLRRQPRLDTTPIFAYGTFSAEQRGCILKLNAHPLPFDTRELCRLIHNPPSAATRTKLAPSTWTTT